MLPDGPVLQKHRQCRGGTCLFQLRSPRSSMNKTTACRPSGRAEQKKLPEFCGNAREAGTAGSDKAPSQLSTLLLPSGQTPGTAKGFYARLMPTRRSSSLARAVVGGQPARRIPISRARRVKSATRLTRRFTMTVFRIASSRARYLCRARASQCEGVLVWERA
jgi:hypothetical protein